MRHATPAPISVTTEHARRTLASMNHQPTPPREQPRTAIEQALDALHAGDIEARKKLPATPPGFEWHAAVTIASAGGDAISATITYTVRPIASELRARSPIE